MTSAGQGDRSPTVPQSKEDLKSRNIEAIPQNANHSSALRIGQQNWNLQQNIVLSHKSFGTQINLYQSEGKANVFRKTGCADDPKHLSS